MPGASKKRNKRVNDSFESFDDGAESYDGDAEDIDDYYYYKTKVKCICPSCGIEHDMKMHWTGRGVPKKYCKDCKKNIL